MTEDFEREICTQCSGLAVDDGLCEACLVEEAMGASLTRLDLENERLRVHARRWKALAKRYRRQSAESTRRVLLDALAICQLTVTEDLESVQWVAAEMIVDLRTERDRLQAEVFLMRRLHHRAIARWGAAVHAARLWRKRALPLAGLQSCPLPAPGEWVWHWSQIDMAHEAGWYDGGHRTEHHSVLLGVTGSYWYARVYEAETNLTVGELRGPAVDVDAAKRAAEEAAIRLWEVCCG